jgi:hypothetical protein
MKQLYLNLVKPDLEESFARLYSVSNLGELVKRDADSGVVNIQFKQLKYAGDSHFDVKIVVTKDGNIQINLLMPSFKTFNG